jgi:hypothetical protein
MVAATLRYDLRRGWQVLNWWAATQLSLMYTPDVRNMVETYNRTRPSCSCNSIKHFAPSTSAADTCVCCAPPGPVCYTAALLDVNIHRHACMKTDSSRRSTSSRMAGRWCSSSCSVLQAGSTCIAGACRTAGSPSCSGGCTATDCCCQHGMGLLYREGFFTSC